MHIKMWLDAYHSPNQLNWGWSAERGIALENEKLFPWVVMRMRRKVSFEKKEGESSKGQVLSGLLGLLIDAFAYHLLLKRLGHHLSMIQNTCLFCCEQSKADLTNSGHIPPSVLSVTGWIEPWLLHNAFSSWRPSCELQLSSVARKVSQGRKVKKKKQVKYCGLWLKVKELEDGAERSTACCHQLHERSSPITLLITAKGSGGCILFIRSIY